MREWPQEHRNLGTVIIMMLMACLGLYLFMLRPRRLEVRSAYGALKEKQDKLSESGWPLDSERLNKLLEDMRKQLEGPAGKGLGIKNRSNLILHQTTSMFAPKVEDTYGSTSVFLEEVSRLDYEEEFNLLEQKLQEQETVFAKEILGIDKDTSSVETYQLVLQIWTIEALVDLTLAHGLRLVKDPSVTVNTETGQRQASKLSVLPVRAYALTQEDKDPYILEIPVRMVLHGELANFRAFLRALHDNGRFYPVNHLELKAAVPRQQRDTQGDLRVDRVEVEIECCAFFRFDDEAPKVKFQRKNVLPRGA